MTVDGKQKEVSLWLNMKKPEERNEKDPDMNGNIQDPYKKEE